MRFGSFAIASWTEKASDWETRMEAVTGARLLAWYFFVSVPVVSSFARTSPVTTLTPMTLDDSFTRIMT